MGVLLPGTAPRSKKIQFINERTKLVRSYCTELNVSDNNTNKWIKLSLPLAILIRWLDLLLLAIAGVLICVLFHPVIVGLASKIVLSTKDWPSWIQYSIAGMLPMVVWLLLIHLGGFSFNHLKPTNLLRYPPVWIPALLSTFLYVWLADTFSLIKVHESRNTNFGLYLASILVGFLIIYFMSARSNKGYRKFRPEQKSSLQRNPEQLKSLPYLLEWIRDEAPIVYPSQDLFGLSSIAQRISLILAATHLKTVGIVGPYGSGKSSLLNLIEIYVNNQSRPSGANFKGQILVCRINGWGRNKGSIAQQILTMAVFRLSLEIDCLSVITVPAHYREALVGTRSKWGTIVAALLNTHADPVEIISRLNEILKTAGIRLVVFLEDMDRNSTDDVIRDEMPALLDKLRDFDYISFVLAISTDRGYSDILIRICEHVESVL